MGHFCRHVTPSTSSARAGLVHRACSGRRRGPVACPPASVVPGGEPAPLAPGGLSPSSGVVASHQGWTLFCPCHSAPRTSWPSPGSYSAPPFWREGLSGNTGPWPQPALGAPACQWAVAVSPWEAEGGWPLVGTPGAGLGRACGGEGRLSWVLAGEGLCSRLLPPFSEGPSVLPWAPC